MIKKYRKRPMVIEAVQWNGNNAIEIMLFIGKELKVSKPPHHMEFNENIPNTAYTIVIPTLNGDVIASKGEYIIKGVQGEFYPCKSDIFEATYELVEKEKDDKNNLMIKICPICKSITHYNSYFKAYMCLSSECTWMRRVN
jgi:hypothetical protein